MKAEETLQYIADFYPDLAPTRKHALNHLFCVIGNGYEWENGELVNKHDSIYQRYALKQPVKKAVFRGEQDWHAFQGSWQKRAASTGCRIPARYQFEWRLGEDGRPNRDYAYIYNYPKDITPDWEALLDECRSLLRQDGIEI